MDSQFVPDSQESGLSSLPDLFQEFVCAGCDQAYGCKEEVLLGAKFLNILCFVLEKHLPWLAAARRITGLGDRDIVKL